MLLKRRSDQVDALQKVALFADLNRKQLDLVARQSTQITRPAGATLAQQGRRGREFVLILSGSARVERDGKPVGSLTAGDSFGEISLIDGGPRTATIVAESPCDLLVVDAQSFSALLEGVPAISRQLLKNLCARVRDAQNSVSH